MGRIMPYDMSMIPENDWDGYGMLGDLQEAAFANLTGGDFSGKKYYKANFKGEVRVSSL